MKYQFEATTADGQYKVVVNRDVSETANGTFVSNKMAAALVILKDNGYSDKSKKLSEIVDKLLALSKE